jgi:hypothetical protein
MKGDQKKEIENLVNKIWNDANVASDSFMNKKQVKKFLDDLINNFEEDFKISDDAFDQIFLLIDIDKDENISRGELI